MSLVHRLDAEVRERLITGIEGALIRRSDVAFGLIFGSFLDGEAFRDIDVGIWTTESASPRADVELAAELSLELGLPIDLRRLNEAPVPFLFHALRGRAVGVRDERRLADLMERTAREYHDRAPLLRLATHEAFTG